MFSKVLELIFTANFKNSKGIYQLWNKYWILQNWALTKLTFCHSSKLNVCLIYQLVPKYLPQQFADLMLQTTMASSSCHKTMKTSTKLNISVPIYFVMKLSPNWWNCLQIVISLSQGEARQNKFTKHTSCMTMKIITVFVWEMHSVMQPSDAKTLFQCCCVKVCQPIELAAAPFNGLWCVLYGDTGSERKQLLV